MPYLQLEGTQFPLLKGETRVGRGGGADVQLPGSSGPGEIDVIITTGPEQGAWVKRESPNAVVTVNNVVVGMQSSPLHHGDRLRIGDLELVYADEAHSGETAQVVAPRVESTVAKAEDRARRGRSGGRLVSLVDGRDYTVRADGLSMGREAGCDIVVAATEVSRRHARIELKPDGYVIVDTSTNGVLVNGVRISGSQPLNRGDTIQIGPEQFRFHADLEPRAPAPPPVILATPPGRLPGRAVPPSVPSGESLVKTLPPKDPAPPLSPPQPAAGTIEPPAAEPAESSSAARASSAAESRSPFAGRAREGLATLEVINEGPTKGTRYSIDSPLTHVGRGPHNDVVINDESVSDSHAKIQRRESGWFVVDMDSTNGTYVAGQRVHLEAPLGTANDVRFGGVKVAFRVTGSVPDEGSGTRVIVGYRSSTPKVPQAAIPEDAEPDAPARSTADGGVPKFLIGALLLLGLVVVYLVFRSI
jgi:pSer/pThr/pTyr-binding forkhead associated (FHA) protein